MGCKGSSHAKHPDHTEAVVDSHRENGQQERREPDTAETVVPKKQPEANNAEDSAAASPSPTASPPAHMPSAPNVGEASGEGRKVDAQGRRMKQSHTVPDNFKQGQNVEHNGFRIMPEVEAFTISERSLAPYSLPVEVLTFSPPDEIVISKFPNGDQERKIHCNIRLSDNELDRLKVMQAEARTQEVSFYPSVTAMATRFLSRARMDPKKAIKLMRETQDWREDFFSKGPIREEEVKDDMQNGIVYFSGRDYALRPSIIIRPVRIPQRWYQEKRIDKLIRILIFCMEYFLRYMVVPGRIENLNVIVDLHNLSVTQVPMGALQEVYKVLGQHYIGRVFKFYVCNVSTFLSTMAGVVRAMLTDRQKQKLNILSDLKELHKDFALHQLEKDLGGTRASITRETGGFFPFPLWPGPYKAGFRGDPDMSQVPDGHFVLSHTGCLGRLWDAKRSDDQNSKLDYGPKAVDVFKRCNLPIPPELLVERDTSMNLGNRGVELTQVETEVDTVHQQEEYQNEAEEEVRLDQNGKIEGVSATDNRDLVRDSTHVEPDPAIDEVAITSDCLRCCRHAQP